MEREDCAGTGGEGIGTCGDPLENPKRVDWKVWMGSDAELERGYYQPRFVHDFIKDVPISRHTPTRHKIGIKSQLKYDSPGHYGFAANQDGIFKLAIHGGGYMNPTDIGLENPISLPRTIVDHPNDTIPRDAVVRFRAFLADLFPELATLDIVKTRMCWWVSTSLERVWGKVPII